MSRRPTKPPPMPQPTEDERRQDRETLRRLQEVARVLHQRNLDTAVRLAMEAAAGRGPLVDHFAELGRRYAHTLDTPKPGTKLRVVPGGLATPGDR